MLTPPLSRSVAMPCIEAPMPSSITMGIQEDGKEGKEG